MEFDNLTKLVRDGLAVDHIVQSAATLRRMLEGELSLLLLWQIPPDMTRFFDSDLFGQEVSERFPSVVLDIEEAGKCLGVGRTTACVFHLMRVAEAGLNAIAKRIQYPDSRPMWGPVLAYLDKLLRAPYVEMSAFVKGDVEFFSGISAQMHAVNLAWRRRVMHIDRSYSEDEALRIFEATKGLMQHLAIKLREPDKSERA